MSALSNAATRRDGPISPTAGFASSVIPEALGSDTGVSVDNAPPPRHYPPEPGKKWFVLRITYYRAQRANDYLTSNGIATYMPLKYTIRNDNGKRRRITRPLIPNLLFAYATPEKLDTVLKSAAYTAAHNIITYYYDHFRTGTDGKNPPLTVRYTDMLNFIRLTSLTNRHIMIVSPQQCHYRSGDMVRIVDGEFSGICGRVARVAGQQRVVVELEGVCLATTAYVPSGFIRPMEPAAGTPRQ